MTGPVAAAVRDLEARARDSSATRTTGATSAKRASTDSVERRFDTKEVASLPDGDPEPERKRAAPDRLCQTQVRNPNLVRGPRLDQVAAPETPAGKSTSLVSSTSQWSRVSMQKPAEMIVEDAMLIAS